MSCWVVPALAAEFWGIPLAEVMTRIARGEIATKTELGFTLVDVVPQGPRLMAGQRPAGPRPATYVAVPLSQTLSQAERDALAEEIQEEETVEVGAGVAEGSSDDERLDWRAARMSASRLRRAPRRPGLAA